MPTMKSETKVLTEPPARRGTLLGRRPDLADQPPADERDQDARRGEERRVPETDEERAERVQACAVLREAHQVFEKKHAEHSSHEADAEQGLPENTHAASYTVARTPLRDRTNDGHRALSI